MTNQIRNPNDRKELVRYFCLFVASTGACTACWWAAGTSLGLIFGGFFITTFLAPAAVLGRRKLILAIISLGVVALPVAAAWLGAVLLTPDTLAQWIKAILVLIAYDLAIGAIAVALAKVKVPEVLAAAGAILIGLAWLTWPVWLSSSLVNHGAAEAVANLVKVHPPLVVNGILTSEPAWTERSIAYHLTDLNQDVPLQLPSGPAACVAVHGLIAIVLWATVWGMARRARRLYSY
jgi:hypothetical protein